ncbi:N-acetyltransferase [Spraguea lophii 42_110]|uniref:N-acetyltransferase n=1 Tax=Spraguea lophii (strain 42_110) TaxID=1358809 RepID=S7W970_SPRLO|nr:N-acetyltransferase [Spraguea lophii 42_110]
MISYDLMYPGDIFNMGSVNIDYLTENYTPGYYFHYIFNYPNEIYSIKRGNKVLGYLIGKNEEKDGRTGHVTAISIAQSIRKFGFGSKLMDFYENEEEGRCASFIDLFVRKSNKKAIDFYSKRNYVVNEIIENYYSNPVEDAYDMRKYFNDEEQNIGNVD